MIDPAPTAWTLTPQLRDFEEQIARIRADAQALLAGMSEAQFQWKPALARWSVGECLAHLNVTGEI